MFTLATPDILASWDSALTDRSDPHILQTSSWAAFKGAHSWQPLYVYEPDLHLPVLVLKRNLPLLPSSILYVPRGPALDWTDPAAAPVLSDLLDYLTGDLARSHHAVLVKVESEALAENQPVAQTFTAHQFSHSHLHPQFKKTMWIDLRPAEDEILAKFHQKTRYNIRLAQRKGVRITSEATDENLRLFYDLHLSTGARGHFPVRTFSYYSHLWKTLLEAGRAKLFLAWHGEDLLGGVFLFAYGSRAYYQYGASSEIKRECMPNYLLQWTAMEWAKAEGYETYDMVGLPEEPDPKDPFYGVWKFKQGFQGEVREFMGAMDYYPSDLAHKQWSLLYPLARRWLWYTKRDVFF